jgi:hypothetical protein
MKPIFTMVRIFALLSLLLYVPPLMADTKGRKQITGWHQVGSPVVQNDKSKYKASCAYFGFDLIINISNCSAEGAQSWKDCSNQTKCSGAYKGVLTWTKPPAYMKPDSKFSFKAASRTSANNKCGQRNIGSGITVKSIGLYIDVTDAAPKAPVTYTVPKGSPGQKMTFDVFLKAANVNGKVTYHYIYK